MSILRLKIYRLTMAIFLLPLISFAQIDNITCSKIGYTIETINGIFTKKDGPNELDGAIGNRNSLKREMNNITVFNNEPLTFDYLYNPTHGLFDLTDVAIQKTFEGVDMKDPDFLKILKDASIQVKTQKLLLVAHSQGNFYSNNFYKVVTDNGDVSTKSIGVYSVATPAGYVAGGGTYRTSDTDTVINNARDFLPGKILQAHDSIIYKESDDSGRGHGFREIYLEYRGEEIKKEIEESLSKLSIDSSRSETIPCINSPKALSTFEKIIRPVVYSVESVAATGVATFISAKTVTIGAYNIAGAAAKAVANTAVAVASTISSGVTSLMNDTGNLANNNSAAVILATQPHPQVQSIEVLPATDTANTHLPTTFPSPAQKQITPANNQTVESKEPALSSVSNSNTASVEASVSGGGGGGSVSSASQVLGVQTIATVLSAPALSAPQCAYSLATSTDGCLIATTTIRFEWAEVSGAAYYVVSKNNTYSTTTEASTNIIAPDFSDYTFEVAAIDPKGNKSATSTKIVSVATIPIAINEIAWMGTLASTNDEWIELKNNTAHAIDLSLWVLRAEDSTPYIPLVGLMAPHEYRVLERRADTATSIPAGQVYGNGVTSWALNNTGEQLVLSYASTTIDQTPAGVWVAGYNNTTAKRTMERASSRVSGTDVLNWGTNDGIIKNGTDATRSAIGGTPGAENSVNVLHDTDIVPPVVTVQGSNPVTVSLGSVYVDEGAIATDAVDGARTVNTNSAVNTAIIGTYAVTYTASDLSYNTATSTRVVNVVDVVGQPAILSFSDLNKNGLADSEELEVVATSTVSLLAGEYHFHNLTITNNATIVAGGDPSSASLFKGVKIVADNLTVTAGSAISANGQGSSAGTSGAVTTASYGGVGGDNTATSTYGSAIMPVDLGSGTNGSRGGGAIRIVVADTFLNNGSISANGNGYRTSGGSVYVTTQKLTGNGTFSAKGGDTAWPNNFAGGGGRIAVHYEQSSFSGSAGAAAGVYCFYGCNSAGRAGTVVFFDVINNDLYPKSSFRFQVNDGPHNFHNIFLVNGVSADTEKMVSITAEKISLQNGSGLIINDKVTIKSAELSMAQNSSVSLVGAPILDISSIIIGQGSVLSLSGDDSTIVGTLDIQNGGTLTVAQEKILSLTTSNLSVSSGAFISANLKGYKTGIGPGSSSLVGAGGSYGGVGLQNTASSTYGSETQPTDFGSGGGGTRTSAGGAIRIVSTGTLTNNGTISANGDISSSGGSIYVTSNNFAGTGVVSANGGNIYGAGYFSGPGGGGRVAVYYQESSFTGTIKALGGTGSYDGWSSVSAGSGTTVFEKIGALPVESPPTPVTLSSDHSITAFSVLVATSTISGVVDEGAHTVSLVVPFGTDPHALLPAVEVSALATSSPASLVVQDFINPVVYMVIAEDGSDQPYVVTVTVTPDTTPPSISSYTFNEASADVLADFATTTPAVSIVLTASENVDWVSIKIEDQNTPGNYKTFFSGEGCLDGSMSCSKSWNGVLSAGVLVPDAVYRVKVNIKDGAGNVYNDYLAPYHIVVKQEVPVL